MYETLASQVVLVAVLVTVAFAWWRGGAPERTGALFNGVICLGVTLFQALTKQSFDTLPILIADGVLATGFLILAFRYASLWLAAAMLLQGAVFTIHAAALIGLLPESHLYYYYAAMNILAFAVMFAIILGTIGAWMRRRRSEATLG